MCKWGPFCGERCFVLKTRFLSPLSQVPPRLRGDEVRARRPARRGRHQPQTDGHHGAGDVCDRVCSRHGSVYAATVSTAAFNSLRSLRSRVRLARSFLRPRAAAGGGRSVADRDRRITTARRNTAYPSTLPRAVLYPSLQVISHFTFIDCRVILFIYFDFLVV